MSIKSKKSSLYSNPKLIKNNHRARPETLQAYRRTNYFGDSSRLKRDTGWTQKYSLDQTLGDMIQYFREYVISLLFLDFYLELTSEYLTTVCTELITELHRVFLLSHFEYVKFNHRVNHRVLITEYLTTPNNFLLSTNH